ncbi:hypothetical protein PIB30_029972 [Stylosanthes scabra]|uniref:Aminotransferase-like plant mobile domain-containing protein n=1 Tax=Stylosanthes scabra TaxID=79078 RepID=A0ABU6XAK6_9FABA|nr:hypothetical protein [Stylosanthes scabra]
MVWLRQRLQHIPADADPDTLRQYARCDIMLFIGAYLMPDKSDNLVHIRWLPLLRDFPMASEKMTMDIAGCVPLILSWIYHRFPGSGKEYPTSLGRAKTRTDTSTNTFVKDLAQNGPNHEIMETPLGMAIYKEANTTQPHFFPSFTPKMRENRLRVDSSVLRIDSNVAKVAESRFGGCGLSSCWCEIGVLGYSMAQRKSRVSIELGVQYWRFIRTENPWVGDSHSIYIIRLFRYMFKLGKLAKRSFGFFESSISASSSLPLWSCGELGVYV